MSQLVNRARKDPKSLKLLKKHEETVKSKGPIQVMSRKLLIFSIGCLLAALTPYASCEELPISNKLTLSDVLKLGFRPSSMLPSNRGMLRCWEKREIVLKFENGFECPIKAEDVTFEVYDDDQISSVRISGDSDYPLGFEEAIEKARFIFGKVGTVPRELDEWYAEVKKRRMFSSFGRFTKLNGEVKMGVQLLPTLQKIDQKPALLGIIVEWKYLGSGPLGGSRSKPVTTPQGFDWDMSYEAWSKRIIEKGSHKPKASSPDHRDTHDACLPSDKH